MTNQEARDVLDRVRGILKAGRDWPPIYSDLLLAALAKGLPPEPGEWKPDTDTIETLRKLCWFLVGKIIHDDDEIAARALLDDPSGGKNVH